MSENDDEGEIVAVINLKIGSDEYKVPIDNWNKAVDEGRTEVVVLGDELHFFSKEDAEKIKKFMLKQKGE